MTNDPDRGLTLRELVLEIREDVRGLRTETKVELATLDTRVEKLETSGLILRGAWMTLGVLISVVAGGAGLALGLFTVL